MNNKNKGRGWAGRCAAPCAGTRYIPATGTTARRGQPYAKLVWSATPGDTLPQTAAGQRESGTRTVTLYELSQQYRLAAEALRLRIRQVEELRAMEPDEREQMLLDYRLRLLRSMWRDTRAVCIHMEHYYEKGVCRDETYVIR